AYDSVDASKKLTVAAIHGNALGGGLETALCCHYRVALRSARVGLPEVLLGLLPGAGGTQRLPRIVGAAEGLELITSGAHIDAPKAATLGIIDEIVPGEDFDALLQGALAFTRQALAQGKPLRQVRATLSKLAGTDPALFQEFRTKNARKWTGLIAPQKIVDCIEMAATRSWDEGYAFELARFLECKESPQRAALSHVFFAEREAAKIPGLGREIKPLPVTSVAIIGAGTMGGGIAMAFANKGIAVKQLEMSAEALQRGRGIMQKNYDTSVSRGSLPKDKADAALARITGTLDYQDLAQADLVIEAVFEDMAVKQEVFRKLDAVMKPGAILATNTSYLDIDQIAAVTQRPDSVLGLHFFSPANVMKLLEVVRGARSAPQTLATGMSLAKRLGKIAVLAGNCDGFIGNRILANYAREAEFLLEEGATPWQVDEALKGFGLPMGIFLMRDMAGLDIGWRVRQRKEATRPKHLRHTTLPDRICEMGRFGQKTGAGYYQYQGREASPDPVIEQLIIEYSARAGITRKPVSSEEIVRRILTAMAYEGAKILDEGIASRASDIDVTYVYGYGFPRYRGGPMFWAEQQGLAQVRDWVLEYHRVHGDHWKPVRLLDEAAAAGSWKAVERSR
ncbi:MAG: 3-hydroxyacyl-CoA dehydrogenase NAD-binding domain-containing protein, partial [Steroidobacteraceae bacterium]